jgi:SnoaL-like domain
MATQVQPSSGSDAKQVVLEFGDAINAEDYQLARKYVTEDLKHTFPFGTHDTADAYFQQLELVRPKFDIHKTFVDGNDVCVLYYTTVAGVTMFASGWFKVEDGKVSSFTVVFDPRSLLAVWSPSN